MSHITPQSGGQARDGSNLSCGPADTFLNVPFTQKDEAKALGARWDGTVKRWYVPRSCANRLNIMNRWRSGRARKFRGVAPSAKVDTYLSVPFRENNEAKALGAWWNQLARRWYVPVHSKSKQALLRRWGDRREMVGPRERKTRRMEPEAKDGYTYTGSNTAYTFDGSSFCFTAGEGEKKGTAGLTSGAAEVDTYLDVPFHAKEEAKALGAWWHQTKCRWYIPVNCATRQDLMSRWGDNKSVSTPTPPPSPETMQPLDSKSDVDEVMVDCGSAMNAPSDTTTPEARKCATRVPPNATVRHRTGKRASARRKAPRTRHPSTNSRTLRGSLTNARVRLVVPLKDFTLAATMGAEWEDDTNRWYAPKDCKYKQELVNRWAEIDLSSLPLHEYVQSIVDWDVVFPPRTDTGVPIDEYMSTLMRDAVSSMDDTEGEGGTKKADEVSTARRLRYPDM